MCIRDRFTSGPNSAEELSNYLAELLTAAEMAQTIHLDQTSLVANTNLVAKYRMQAGIRLLTCSIRSSMARNESRGVHKRADFKDTNPELIHHITVDNEGNVGTLALRKGQKDNWVLAPQ